MKKVIPTPVEKDNNWLDSGIDQTSNNIIVMCYTFTIDRSVAEREEPRPLKCTINLRTMCFRRTFQKRVVLTMRKMGRNGAHPS